MAGRAAPSLPSMWYNGPANGYEEGAATQHKRPLTYVTEGLTLTVALALVTLVGQWLLMSDRQTPQALAGAATPIPAPTHTLRPAPTIAPSPTPSRTPSPTTPPTATPTPTLDVGSATPTPSPTLVGTATVTSPLPSPTPAPLVEQPEGTMNILLLGSDEAATVAPGRTDVIVVVTVFTDPPFVSLLSIPRDLYVWVPGVGYERINLAYRRGAQTEHPDGGAGLLKETIEYNLGIPVHRWVHAGFDGFVELVDALGGADVAVECPLSDTFPDPDAESGHTDVDWLPGMYHLDGKQALWYVRSRWSTNDLDRNRRQQQVLRGLYGQVLSLGVIPRIPEAWGVLNECVTTDLKLEELVYLGTIGAQLEPGAVRSTLISRGVVQGWVAPSGAQVLLVYDEALRALLEVAMSPPSQDRAAQAPTRIQVWNATGVEGLGHVAAERLRLQGFEVAGPNQIEGQYPQTLLFDFTTSPKGSAVPLLMRLYGLSSGQVIYEPTADRGADYGLVLAADYDPCLATQVTWWPEDVPTPTPVPQVGAAP